MSDFDVKISNARIVDGINKEYVGSLGVKDGRIIETGKVTGDAEREIDATGLYALPGFIDPHSHGDWGFAWYPNCESAVM
ncbi:MAG: D-aminoacylase, partial [Candidatus Bathyarchaeota archaeon]|nr:D-aminoacylase [Candidatus Bathyarchaeota archaeon]